MPANRTVAVLVGSLRKESFSRKVANAVAEVAPATLRFTHIDIGALPHYNQDLDPDSPPAAWVTFRDAVRAADAVLFVTPEYNRSVPGVLKNAIDIASRPYGKSAWSGKPAAVMSVSPGAIGGFGANHHLRQSLVFLDMPTLQQPEAYAGMLGDAFDASGEVTKDSLKQFLTAYVQAFAAWIEKQKG